MTIDAATAERLHAVVATAQANDRLPSVVAGVARDGELEWTFGDADLQYRIGSITKVMTAVLVLQLRDEGGLALDDRVHRFLPGIAFGDRTIRELLGHLGALPSEPPGPWWERAPGMPFELLASRLSETEAPVVDRGSYHYSNLGYALLGQIVALVRGASWWDVLQKHVLGPLEMERTTYLPDLPHVPGYSVTRSPAPSSRSPRPTPWRWHPRDSLWSTVGDLTRLTPVLLGERADVLSLSSLRELAEPVSDGYGLGLRLLDRPAGRLRGHTGSMPGFQACLFVDPERGSSAVVLANSTFGLDSAGIGIALHDALSGRGSAFEAPEPWSPTVVVPPGVEDVLGVWHWGNTAHAFRWEHERLEVSTLDYAEVEEVFVPEGVDTFRGVDGYHRGELLRVVRDDVGAVRRLEVATFVFTRHPYE